jgi:outer membrane protein TolC
MISGRVFATGLDLALRTARRRLFFSSVLVVPLFPFLSFGEVQNQKTMAKPSSKDLPLSLERVTASALRNNPAIQAARAAWQMKRNRIQQEAAWEDPKLSFRSLLGRFVNISPNGFTDQVVGVEQEIPISGKNRSRERVAVAEALAAFEEFRRQELDVVSKVRTSFFQLANYYVLLDLNRADEISLDQTLEISRTKFEVGSQTQADVLMAETERQKIVEARRDLQQKLSDEQTKLKVLMNVDPFIPLGKPAVQDYDLKLPSIGELRSKIFLNRPEVRQAEALVTAALAKLQLAKRQWIPDPMVSLEADHYNAGSQVFSEINGGVSISLPWFNRQKYRAGEREAQDGILQAQETLDGMRTQALGMLRDQLEKIETLHHHLELYGANILPAARQTVSANQADYETNKKTFLDVLSAQRSLRELEVMYEQDLTDHKIALAELEALIGSDLGIFRNNSNQASSSK